MKAEIPKGRHTSATLIANEIKKLLATLDRDGYLDILYIHGYIRNIYLDI